MPNVRLTLSRGSSGADAPDAKAMRELAGNPRAHWSWKKRIEG